MKDLRLTWEPENLTPLADIEERLMTYTKGQGGIIILGNATLLALSSGSDDVEDSKKAMNEARFIIDFRTVPLREGGYMVAFHKAVSVFVGQAEFDQMKTEIATRLNELKFPGEVFFVPPNEPPEHLLIGLYARGKLQRDAYDFKFHKRL
jgi:hypothetical protein